MQGVEMHYPPTATYMTSTRQQPNPQQYAPYQASPILSSTPQEAMYDTLPSSYQHASQSRHSAALEVMSTQLNTMPATAFDTNPHHHSNHPQQLHQLPSTSSPYTTTTSHPQQPQPTSYRHSLPTQPHPYIHHTSPSTSYLPHQHHQPQPPQIPSPPTDPTALTTGLQTFHTTLSTSLTLILSSNLPLAASKLLDATRWLTSHIIPLGLHHDDETLYPERLELWERVNVAWEGLALRAKDIAELEARAGDSAHGQQGRAGVGGLSVKEVRELVEEAVKTGDELEGFGLVDYELGFAEELVVAGLVGVLDVLEQQEGEGGEAGGVGGEDVAIGGEAR